MLPRFAPSDFFCLGSQTLLFSIKTVVWAAWGRIKSTGFARPCNSTSAVHLNPNFLWMPKSPGGGGGGVEGGWHLQEHCILPLLLGSLSNSVFERRKLTGSGLFFHSLAMFLPKCSGKMSVQEERNTAKQMWWFQGILNDKMPYFRLKCVAQKRLCLTL